MSVLSLYLEKKGAEYAPFDQKRFADFYAKYLCNVKHRAKIVQIVGTNGKGSTGRFLSQILQNAGFYVGHFTSPHINNFTERFWLDGRDASLKELDDSFCELIREFGGNLYPLSYFEILTLLGFWFFKDRVDFLILEAGVGGEKDSTTCFKKELLLVTPIDLDHQDLLGESIEEIARTKLKASNCKTIVGFQENESVRETIKKEFFDRDIVFLKDILAQDEKSELFDYAGSQGMPLYLFENLCLAYRGARELGVKPATLEGVCAIAGRFERVAKNIVLDVGHNIAAARRVARELGNKKVTLIFNSFRDKDPKAALIELKDKIKKVEIFEVCHERIIDKSSLVFILESLALPYSDFEKIRSDEEYLVFGSFSVASEFLRRGLERDF